MLFTLDRNGLCTLVYYIPPAPSADTPTSNDDILTANGLATSAEGNGDGNGGSVIEKGAVNSEGQTFCYEPLPTEENCLKPIKVEDPPLCSPK